MAKKKYLSPEFEFLNFDDDVLTDIIKESVGVDGGGDDGWIDSGTIGGGGIDDNPFA